MNYLLLLLTVIIAIIPIISNGKFVNEDNVSLKKRIKPLGYTFILLILISNIFAFYSSDKALKEAKAEATKQAKKDSAQIDYLTQLADINIKKTDAVKVQLIDNAVKVLEEQRLAVERERENAFILLKKEVEDNLSKILLDFSDETIESYKDTAKGKIFTAIRLDNLYINKYVLISTNSIINEYLLDAIESNNNVNIFANSVNSVNSKSRNFQVDQVMKMKEIAYRFLVRLYIMTKDLKSYKSFEAIKQIIVNTNIDRKKLSEHLRKKNNRFNYLNEVLNKNKVSAID